MFSSRRRKKLRFCWDLYYLRDRPRFAEATVKRENYGGLICARRWQSLTNKTRTSVRRIILSWLTLALFHANAPSGSVWIAVPLFQVRRPWFVFIVFEFYWRKTLRGLFIAGAIFCHRAVVVVTDGSAARAFKIRFKQVFLFSCRASLILWRGNRVSVPYNFIIMRCVIPYWMLSICSTVAPQMFVGPRRSLSLRNDSILHTLQGLMSFWGVAKRQIGTLISSQMANFRSSFFWWCAVVVISDQSVGVAFLHVFLLNCYSQESSKLAPIQCIILVIYSSDAQNYLIFVLCTSQTKLTAFVAVSLTLYWMKECARFLAIISSWLALPLLKNYEGLACVWTVSWDGGIIICWLLQ